MGALWAQARAEVAMTLRRGESLLLALGIPVLLLAFFSSVEVLPMDEHEPVRFLFPGVLALAVMSTAMVSLAIATGFERHYRVLKRLGATPLGRPRLLGAKTLAIVVIELLQLAVLTAEAGVLGFFDGGGGGGGGPGEPARWLPAVGAMLLATAAFAGIGMLMAGTLPAMTTLAAVNGLYLVLLLLSGMVVPFDELPPALASAARALPSGALAGALHASLSGDAVPGSAWLVLAAWAVAAPAAAARLFRWE